MQKIILFVIYLLLSALGVIGCQSTSDNTGPSSESRVEQSEESIQSEVISDVSLLSEEINESEISENGFDDSEEESMFEESKFFDDSEEESVFEDESIFLDYSEGGGIVLPDDEW